jgi:hypothetical protein
VAGLRLVQRGKLAHRLHQHREHARVAFTLERSLIDARETPFDLAHLLSGTAPEPSHQRFAGAIRRSTLRPGEAARQRRQSIGTGRPAIRALIDLRRGYREFRADAANWHAIGVTLADLHDGFGRKRHGHTDRQPLARAHCSSVMVDGCVSGSV